MAFVFVGLGSNIDPQRHLRLAFAALGEQFLHLQLSPVYQCRSIGFNGDDFVNLVASFETSQSVAGLQRSLKNLEAASGRTGRETKWSGRTLDIDILTYDDLAGVIDGVELPRDEILKHAHVLKPLADLAPDRLHPVERESYLSLWQRFSGERSIKPIDFG